MAGIFGAVLVCLVIMTQFLTVKAPGNWLACKVNNRAKHEFESFAMGYSVVWISVFGVVVAGGVYEYMDETHYMGLCVTLALPFLLQPFFDPMPAERNIPLYARYSFKANVWLAIFSFIGNYWYTHYFYSVLRARYTFPSWRLNDVPIPLFFATHFYFVFYHTMSNVILRKIETRYAASTARTMFFWSTVFAFSYFTAFMETLTISSFPDYSFEDRYMAYTVGSAFYGIYFIVSYPVFYR
jgi:cycloeucalenol cycloisomerase